MKQRILLVGDYNRPDFLQIARLLQAGAEFFFIEHLNRQACTRPDWQDLGQVLFWKDFNSAFELLDRIRPDKVIFYFIESYNHVALTVACKQRGLPVIHLEHGVRFTPAFASSMAAVAGGANRPAWRDFSSLLRHACDKVKNRRFFRRTVAQSGPESRDFLQRYFQIRSTHSVLDTFLQLPSHLRLADRYISFSPAIFRFHQQLEGLDPDYPVCFTGIPAFDDFYKWQDVQPRGPALLFIDQPFYEQQLMGWTPAYKAAFLQSLAGCAQQQGRRLYIKAHPCNEPEQYQAVLDKGSARMVGADWAEVMQHADAVVGFASTLMLPFMAMKHMCVFSMELHPAPPEGYYSAAFRDAGVCHACHSWEALAMGLSQHASLLQEQQQHKEAFVQEWMYRFDGQSAARLRQAVLSEQDA